VVGDLSATFTFPYLTFVLPWRRWAP